LTETFMDLPVGTELEVVSGRRTESGNLWGLLRAPDGREVWVPGEFQQVISEVRAGVSVRSLTMAFEHATEGMTPVQVREHAQEDLNAVIRWNEVLNNMRALIPNWEDSEGHVWREGSIVTVLDRDRETAGRELSFIQNSSASHESWIPNGYLRTLRPNERELANNILRATPPEHMTSMSLPEDPEDSGGEWATNDTMVAAARPPFPFWVRVAHQPAFDLVRVGDRIPVFNYRDGRYLTQVGGSNLYWIEANCVEGTGTESQGDMTLIEERARPELVNSDGSRPRAVLFHVWGNYQRGAGGTLLGNERRGSDGSIETQVRMDDGATLWIPRHNVEAREPSRTTCTYNPLHGTFWDRLGKLELEGDE
jgi:hypothetical protein